MIALTESGQQDAVANAIDGGGGRSIITEAGVPGVRLEDERSWMSIVE
jgi:hypothetical protein